MHVTLSSLVERAMMGNQKPLEYYLREQSRLPGPRANLELVNDLSYLLAALVTEQPANVRALLSYLIQDDHKANVSNTPAEFVMLCGIVAFGACAAAQPQWLRYSRASALATSTTVVGAICAGRRVTRSV